MRIAKARSASTCGFFWRSAYFAATAIFATFGHAGAIAVPLAFRGRFASLFVVSGSRHNGTLTGFWRVLAAGNWREQLGLVLCHTGPLNGWLGAREQGLYEQGATNGRHADTLVATP